MHAKTHAKPKQPETRRAHTITGRVLRFFFGPPKIEIRNEEIKTLIPNEGALVELEPDYTDEAFFLNCQKVLRIFLLFQLILT